MIVSNTNTSRSRRGFTIIELVVVIAVVAILAAILVPVFSSVSEQAEQRALRAELKTVYTAFSADCGFRDEPVKNMDQYTFVRESALQFTASAVTAKESGYKWNGSDDAAVSAVSVGSITASTAIYGPFNGYYLLGAGMALNWTGSGTEAEPYLISSYQELRSIAEQVARGNNFSGKFFRLEKDLSINSASWLPIGGYLAPTQADTSGSIVFSGNFDGNGHTISLSYGRVLQDGYCLFGYVSGATVKNLQVAGNIDVDANAGGIAAKANNSTFQNCASSMNVAGDHHVGGIVGNATGSTKILGCMNTGKVEAYATATAGVNSAVGGIVGEAASGVKLSDCCNRGAILGMGGTVGGIAGIAKSNLDYCINEGPVESKGYAAQHISGSNGLDSLVGGIVGWGGGTARLNSCGNSGTVIAAFRSAGGIAGGDAIIVNAANVGNVTAKGYVGGIMGTVSNTSCTVTNAMNAGTVFALGEDNGGTYSGPAGGIVGKVNSTSAYTVSLAVNGGQVYYRKDAPNVSYSEVGMIIGSANGAVTLSSNYLSLAKGVYVGNNSATTTAVGKSSSTNGAPTTQTNQSALASALNGAVGSNQKWTVESSFFGGLYVPIRTNVPDYATNDSSVGEELRLALDTSFTGANTIYSAFPAQTELSKNETKYTFLGWSVSGTSYAPGKSITISNDTVLAANWKTESHKVEPLPFG